jgi:hypothetical protein
VKSENSLRLDEVLPRVKTKNLSIEGSDRRSLWLHNGALTTPICRRMEG